MFGVTVLWLVVRYPNVHLHILMGPEPMENL